MFDLKKICASLAVAGAAAFSPMSAGAVTLSGLTLMVTDTDSACGNGGVLVSLSSTVDSSLSATFDGGAGCASGTLTGALFTDETGQSSLTLLVGSISSVSNLLIEASYDMFAGASATPLLSTISMNTGVSVINTAGEGGLWINGYAYDQSANENLVGSGFFTNPSVDESVGSISMALADPFKMMISAYLSGNSTAAFVGTLSAAVPLPAGGLLLLTALGGLGLARRRRSAEPAVV